MQPAVGTVGGSEGEAEGKNTWERFAFSQWERRPGKGAGQWFSDQLCPKYQQIHLVNQWSFRKHPSTENRRQLCTLGKVTLKWIFTKCECYQRWNSRREGCFNSQVEINMATLIYSTLTQLATANYAPLLISLGAGGRPDMLKAIRSLIDNESCSSWAP